MLGSAKAFLFPQNEDAGIAPMEGLCTGTPCIAFKKGGALGMVHDYDSENTRKNGIFFKKQTVESLTQALIEFESQEEEFLERRTEISKNMQKFSRENFEKNFAKKVEKFLEEQ